jgi:hypothetical protein
MNACIDFAQNHEVAQQMFARASPSAGDDDEDFYDIFGVLEVSKSVAMP